MNIGGMLGNGIYRVGSFNFRAPKEGKTIIASKIDKVAVEGELMASLDESKECSHKDGIISFPITIDGKTNNGQDAVAPVDWFLVFKAVHDYDAGKANELEVAPHPDSTLMDDRLSKIKPGGNLARRHNLCAHG